MTYFKLFFLGICLVFGTAYGQNIKIAQAVFADVPPKIDGYFDDAAWANAPIMTDFTELEPQPNRPSSQKTEVRIVYTMSAIYVSAKMRDSSPDSILRQLCVRDDIFSANADNFGIHIDAMHTRQNAFAFMVTAAGVQYDDDNDDEVWDAVWRSKVRITDEGWQAEIEIPYSQLRFPPAAEQVWGINFSRTIRRKREISYWARLDPTIDNRVLQFGELHGLNNVRPPLRLSLTPYIATYLRHFDDGNSNTRDWTPSATAGADLKYGINESFTLDVALIPDFGDIQSDDLEFNLSPFEIYYSERRPFFTEGIELFNRGGLFYSRRIGGRPSRYDWANGQLDSNEYISRNAETSQLINAFKVSGRTKKRLGIGVFNAVTAPAYASVHELDSLTGRDEFSRRIRTEPFTNYNVLVLDQQFGKNSYLSFIQTSVLRFGNFADAYAWGTEYRIVDKKNQLGIVGNGAYSFINLDPELTAERNLQGFKYDISLQKMRGNFRFTVGNKAVSPNFDINDLGFVTATNFINTYASVGYNVFKPFWKYNTLRTKLSIYHEMLFSPNKFARVELAANVWGTFRNFLSAGFDVAYQPLGYTDYYEARNNFQPWQKPVWGRVGAWFSSDYRKPFALDGSFSYRKFAAIDSTWAQSDILEFALSPLVRLSDRFNFVLETNPIFRRNNIGYVTRANFTDDNGTPRNAVIFGSRYRQDLINTLSANYLFNDVMSISLRIRHYWSYVLYSRYYELSPEGKHLATAYAGRHDQRYNAFNLDLIYRWRFAPGSELNIVWKNAVLDFSTDIERDFARNFAAMYEENQRNSFSIKLLYFLDVGKMLAKK
jgi:hypothetical protein